MNIFRQTGMHIAVGTLLSVLLSALYACHGIDMTDTCLQLYLQKNAFAGSGDTWMTVPLANFAGGAWLSVFPRTGKMYWAHLGGAIIYGIITFFSLKIYFLFFGKAKKYDWLIILGSIFFLARKTMIHYYTAPVALVIVFFWLFLKATKDFRSYFTIGVISGIIFFTRFSFFAILCIPLIMLTYHAITARDSWKPPLCGYIVGGLTSAIPLLFLYIIWKNNFSSAQSELSLCNIVYRAKSLLYIIPPIGETFSIGAGIAVAVKFIESSISKKEQQRYGWIVVFVSFIFATALLIFYSIKYGDGKYGGYFGLLPNQIIMLKILPAMLFTTLLISIWKSDSYVDPKYEKPFLISLIIASLLVPIGSDVAFCKLTYLAPVFIPLLGGLVIHRARSQNVFRRYIFFSIMIGGIITQPLYSYLDAPVFSCVASPSHPTLKYMRTTKKRAAEWDKLLLMIQENMNDEQEILLVGYLNFGPLFLLDIQDWNHGVCTGGNDFMKRFQLNIAAKSLPHLAFVDEKSKEFTQFKLILQNSYVKIFAMDDPLFQYSIWKIK